MIYDAMVSGTVQQEQSSAVGCCCCFILPSALSSRPQKWCCSIVCQWLRASVCVCASVLRVPRCVRRNMPGLAHEPTTARCVIRCDMWVVRIATEEWPGYNVKVIRIGLRCFSFCLVLVVRFVHDHQKKKKTQNQIEEARQPHGISF